MSFACLEVRPPAAYRANSASIQGLPVPPLANRGFSSISRSFSERPGLLLGSSLLADDLLFKAFFQEVRALQEDENEDSPPDSHALAEILRLVPFSREQLAQRWFVPRIASDGFGGVRLTWRKGHTEVRAVISGAGTKRRSYLYWESGDEYYTIYDFTPATLLSCLTRQEKAAALER